MAARGGNAKQANSETATQHGYHNGKETSFAGNQSTELDSLVSVGRTELLVHL